MTKRRICDKQFRMVSVDMFRVDVAIAVNMTEREVERKIRKICGDVSIIPAFLDELRGWDAKAPLGRMCLLGGGFVVLLNSARKDDRVSIATLVHEMVHVAQYLLRKRRIPLSEDTEEVHAYLTEYLVHEAMRRLC